MPPTKVSRNTKLISTQSLWNLKKKKESCMEILIVQELNQQYPVSNGMDQFSFDR